MIEHDGDPALMSAKALLDLYRLKRLSPVETMIAIGERIDKFDPYVNAFVVRNQDVMTAARESEARWRVGRPLGSLDGIPCTVKDVMDMTGYPTRSGSLMTSTEVARDDAPVVLKLKRAGAIILGKTATTEFGWKAPGDAPQSGVTRNPWDLSRTPGGSSSGAAAAGAACFGPMHVGTDAGGSIRVPAAWSGLVGLKPTYGRVPQWPVGAFAHVACAGPLARTTYDAALMLSAMAGPDLRDPYCLPSSVQDFEVKISEGVAGLRIAAMMPKTEGQGVNAAAGTGVVDRACKLLEDGGAEVHLVDLPLFELSDSFDRQWGAAVARIVASYAQFDEPRLDPGMLLLAKAHGSMSAVDFLEAEVLGARFAKRMADFHCDYDLLVCPTVPCPPPRADLIFANEAESRWTRFGLWTYAFNISQQPAISVPLGIDEWGLPTSVQIIGAKYHDDLVLRAAQVIETRTCRVAADLQSNITTWNLRNGA